MREGSQKASRDGLDDYIRVSSPGLLVIVGALSLVLVATVVWGNTVTTAIDGLDGFAKLDFRARATP